MTSSSERRYTARFNHELFVHVEYHIMNHIFGFTTTDADRRTAYLGQERPSQILETILTTSRELNLMRGYQRNPGLRRLIIMSFTENLPLPAIEAISAFLQAFVEAGNTSVDDYLATMKVLYTICDQDNTLLSGVQHASELHHAQGRLVYGLLITAQQLLVAAQATLKHDPSYMAEKLQSAVRYMQTVHETAREYQPHRFQSEIVSE